MDINITVTEIIAESTISETVITCDVVITNAPNKQQSDWDQTDNLAVDYIKNKPTIPTATSDLTNDSDFVSDADYVRTDNNYTDNDVLEVAKIADKQDATDDNLETDSNTIVGAINEVNSIAKGANQALSFDNYQDVIAAMLVNGLNAGQNLYVDTLDVPDLWVKVVEAASVPYTYISDTQFVTDILSGTQIGYYRLSLLETQKVDLTNYYTKDETDQAIEDYAEPLRTADQNYVSDAELEVLRDTSGVNTGDETRETIGDLIELTELETVTDTTKIAASDSAFLKWFSGLTIYTYIRTKLLAVANTWALLQTFTNGLKTTKIIPNSDTTNAIRFTKADGNTDIVMIDSINNSFIIKSANNVGYKSDFVIKSIVDEMNPSNEALQIYPTSTEIRAFFGANGKTFYSLNLKYVSTLEDVPSFKTKDGFAVGYGGNSHCVGRTGNTSVLRGSGGGLNSIAIGFNGGPIYGNDNKLMSILCNGNVGINTTTPETTLDVNGTTTLRDWVYLNNGTHTGDAVGDKRFKITSGVLIYERCTVLHATCGSGTWVTDLQINAEGVIMPKQAASAPTYVKGGMYFDTTLNKLRIGGATDWETLTSV